MTYLTGELPAVQIVALCYDGTKERTIAKIKALQIPNKMREREKNKLERCKRCAMNLIAPMHEGQFLAIDWAGLSSNTP